MWVINTRERDRKKRKREKAKKINKNGVSILAECHFINVKALLDMECLKEEDLQEEDKEATQSD